MFGSLPNVVHPPYFSTYNYKYGVIYVVYKRCTSRGYKPWYKWCTVQVQLQVVYKWCTYLGTLASSGLVSLVMRSEELAGNTIDAQDALELPVTETTRQIRQRSVSYVSTSHQSPSTSLIYLHFTDLPPLH